jgi:hypothetical protein
MLLPLTSRELHIRNIESFFTPAGSRRCPTVDDAPRRFGGPGKPEVSAKDWLLAEAPVEPQSAGHALLARLHCYTCP